MLLGAVVDVALDPAPFRVLRRHQAQPRGPDLLQPGQQLLPQPGVLEHQADLGGQVREQPVLGRRERFPRPLRHRQRPQDLALVAHRQDPVGGRVGRHVGSGGPGRWQRRCVRRPGGTIVEDLTALQPDIGPGGRGALGQDPGHPRQQVLGGVGPRHPPGEVGEDLVGGGPAAIDQPVGQALDPCPHRLESDRHHRRGGDRQSQARPRAALRQRPEADHDRHVHTGDEHGERPVDEGLVDDDVDVVEVVAEDRDADGDRDQRDRVR